MKTQTVVLWNTVDGIILARQPKNVRVIIRDYNIDDELDLDIRDRTDPKRKIKIGKDKDGFQFVQTTHQPRE